MCEVGGRLGRHDGHRIHASTPWGSKEPQGYGVSARALVDRLRHGAAASRGRGVRLRASMGGDGRSAWGRNSQRDLRRNLGSTGGDPVNGKAMYWRPSGAIQLALKLKRLAEDQPDSPHPHRMGCIGGISAVYEPPPLRLSSLQRHLGR